MNARFYAKVPNEIIMCCFTKLIKNLRAGLLSISEKCQIAAALKNSSDLTTGNVWLCDTEIQNMPYKAKSLQQTKHWKKFD